MQRPIKRMTIEPGSKQTSEPIANIEVATNTIILPLKMSERDEKIGWEMQAAKRKDVPLQKLSAALPLKPFVIAWLPREYMASARHDAGKSP